MLVEPGDGDWALRGQGFGLAQVLTPLGIAAVLLTLRPLFIRLLFQPFAHRMKALGPTDTLSPKESEELAKFCKYCWHTVLYVIFWGWALYLYLPQPWAFTVNEVWASYPHAPASGARFQPLFLAETGFYIHGFVESILHDNKRADFAMIVVHHIVAALLILGCVWGNAHRIGLTVIAAQDVGDITMYIGKILHQSTAVKAVQTHVFHSCYLFFISLTWLVTRVMAVGLLVHRGWLFGLNLVPDVDPKVYMNVGALLPGHPKFDGFSMWLMLQLTLLLVMQIAWFVAIFWMFITQVSQGTFHDFILDPDSKKARESAAPPASSPPRRTPSPPKRLGTRKVE